MKNKVMQLTSVVLVVLVLGLYVAAQDTRSGQTVGSGGYTAGGDNGQILGSGGRSAEDGGGTIGSGTLAADGGLIGSGTAVDNGGLIGSGTRTEDFTQSFYGYLRNYLKGVF